MKNRFGRRRSRKTKYDDDQVEFARMVFEGLVPTVVVGGVGMAGAASILGSHYRDRSFAWIALAMVVTVSLRLAVVLTFLARKGRGLTPVSANRYELLYGVSTCLYTSMLAVATVHTFRHNDQVGQLWCVVGSVGISASIAARIALWPWVAQLAGLLMQLPLIFCVLASPNMLVKLTSIFLLMYAVIYCESIQAKFAVVVDQIRTKRQLADLAEQDSLTGLANRRQFQAVLEVACRRKDSLAIFYIDLDRFKAVNDSFGHAVGDCLLRAVAGRLRTVARSSDLIARLGGDEFALLQGAPISKESARALAMRINVELAESFAIHGHTVRIGASVGVRLKTAEDTNPSALLSAADDALYEAKNNGRGGFSIATAKQEKAHLG